MVGPGRTRRRHGRDTGRTEPLDLAAAEAGFVGIELADLDGSFTGTYVAPAPGA